MNRDSRLSELLGIRISTAKSRLRKLIIFELAKECCKNKCFRCGKEIVSIREFSIEHKEAWEKSPNPIASYLSWANIAFSHLGCNAGACSKPNKRYASEAERVKAYQPRNSLLHRLRYTPEKRRDRYLRTGN